MVTSLGRGPEISVTGERGPARARAARLYGRRREVRRPRRPRRAWPAVAAAAVVACGLAACGGGSPPTTTPKALPSAVYTFGVAGTKGPVAQTLHEAPTLIRGIEGTVVRIATSNSDTYALTSAGAVWAWGVGSNGELGDGTTPLYTRTAVRVEFPGGVRITSLPNPMPFDGGLAIDAEGAAWGWGLNAAHDLCLPHATVVTTPQELPLSHVTLGTGARTHSLFDAGGTVYACGSGQFGELGDGSTSSAAVPTRVVGLPRGAVTALTSSWGGSGALMTDGSYYNWGFNRAGQLGNGTTSDSAVPVLVSLPAPVESVFQGGSGAKNGQTVAILSDHSLWLWGSGSAGQLGNGTKQDSTTPARLTLPDGAVPASVSSGGFASYAIDRSGRLWAWGRNDDGQLGTGSRGKDQRTPVLTGLSLTQVSSTAQNAAGLRRT